MSVLVDTTVWSLALRRQRGSLSSLERVVVFDLTDLVASGEACLAGPIRQEVLSGIQHPPAFDDIRRQLSTCEHLVVEWQDYDIAARFQTQLRGHGVAASSTDALICALAYHRDLPIFTTDRDFVRYASHLRISLYQSGGRR